MLATLAALATPALRAQDVGLGLGATPPAALVQDMAGEAADLSQLFVGKKPVVIEFWAAWCPICAKLLPRMEAAQRRYGGRAEFVVIGVGVNETRETMRRHLERHPMPFRFYFDNAGAAVRAFDAPATSYVVALDASGHVVYTGVGENQDVEAAARRAIGAR
jgi:cytochrome c biogenesis protein CcmG, thiol:disulfide interchange protein DsbE